MKQLEVTILGQSYLLSCPDGGEAQLTAAVTTVDQEMSNIRDAGKIRARERIAVLAALNLAYRLAGQPVAGAAAAGAKGATALAAQAPPSTHKAGAADAEPSDEMADAALLGALIQRMDAALGSDGQLL